MFTRTMLMSVAVLTGLLAMVGCQGVEVPYSQRIVVQLREISKENPAQANIQVDSKDVFGPADLAPGETRNIPIHEPSSETGPKLTPGQVHRISWRLEKKGMPGKVGDIEMRIFSGTNTVIKSDSTTYLMPNIPKTWYVDVRLAQPGTAPPSTPRTGS